MSDDVAGTVAFVDAGWITISYDTPQRVMAGGQPRVIYSGQIRAHGNYGLSVGDAVICRIQSAAGHCADPLLEVMSLSDKEPDR